ncbi:MAG: hypothetical protein JW839_12995, partial [Candidatus Lokiarchaeota archaeon]|nr:hypothetical protein [Candidatus Lokiarchaeota archaeon]
LGVLKERVLDVVTLACLAAAFVGIGFMYYMPPGTYLIALIVPAPFGMGVVVDRAIRYSAREHADNIDITIILCWIVALLSILASNLLILYFFLPYTGIIAMAPLLAYFTIDTINRRREVTA